VEWPAAKDLESAVIDVIGLSNAKGGKLNRLSTGNCMMKWAEFRLALK
jgi:hypothetical protein